MNNSTHSRKIVYILFNIILYFCSQQIKSQCVPSSKPFVALGMNWMGAGQTTPYVNLWHGARIYNGNNNTIGADGWPTGPIELIFQTLSGEEYIEYVGTYKMQYKGPISAIERGPAPLVFSNIRFDEATGMTTLDVTWTPKLVTAPSYEYFWIKFRQRVTDIKLMRKGFELDSPELLDPRYVALIKSIGYTTIRFMDFTEANTNHTVNWSDRILPNSTDGHEQHNINDGSGYNEGSRGGNWERAIQIANELDVDMWINIPIRANDDYVLQLARLLKARLKPTLNINIEWGNETWNFAGGFHCFGMVKKLAEEAISRGDLVAYDRDLWSTHRRLPAYKLKKFGEIFATVFGQNEICKRIRLILCGQVAYGGRGDGWSIGLGLDFLANKMNVFPGDWIYAVAGTNYFSPIGGSGGKTQNQILDGLAQDISLVNGEGQYSSLGNGDNPTGNRMDAIASKAKSYGVKYYCYEGGPDLDYTSGGGAVNSQKTAALRSTRMKDLTKEMYTKWFSYYGDDALSCFFNGALSPYYANLYALGEYINQSSPKIDAMTEMRQSPAPLLNAPGRNVIPGIIPAWRSAGYEAGNINTIKNYMWPTNAEGWGGFTDYYTGALKNGVYSIQIKRRNPPSDATVKIAIDG